MSTRGIMGVHIDGVKKYSYNPCDSYPEGLGQDMINDIKKYGAAKLKRLAKNVKVIKKCSTKEEERIIENSNGLYQTLTSGLILDAQDFMNDGLFCEYAYIVDFDSKSFLIYISGDLDTRLPFYNLNFHWNEWLKRNKYLRQ